MERIDILEVEFNSQDIEDARIWQGFMDAKNDGEKTRNLAKDTNIAGYLGHLAVERIMENINLQFTSSRTDKFEKGDDWDIAYDNDFIDVKTQQGEFNEQYFYHQKLHIGDWHKRKSETHYCFVGLERDFSRAYVYGIIGADEFWEIAKAEEFDHPKTGNHIKHHFIYSHQLKPLRHYLLRV